jgi:hypothetical protein
LPKAVNKVLRSRIVQTTDQAKSTAWIRRSLSKLTKNLDAKPLHKKKNQKVYSLNQVKVQNPLTKILNHE